MFSLFSLILYIFVFPICECIQVEISLIDESANMSLKIICGPPSKNSNINNKFYVLWHGTQFGENELQNLSEKFQTGIFMPNLTIQSSKKQMCYLTVPNNYLKNLSAIKKRMLRNDALGSIPMNDGVCPPGYRIHADRCYPCFPGSYTSGQEYECFLCPKDFYMDKKAADSCWPCPGGKKTLAQGADSEESCIYFDETGHAEIKQNPPWIAIFSIIGVIILCVWIVIIILLVRYWKQRKVEDREGGMSRGSYLIIKKRLSTDENAYETIPDGTDDEESIYAEIGDYDDTYETPIRPSDPPIYVDLDAPSLPPRRKDTERRTDSIPKAPSESISEDQYEIPIKPRSTDHQFRKYPKEKYNFSTEKRSDDQYEVPIQRSSDDNYSKIIDDPESHIYSEISPEDERNSNEMDSINNIDTSRSVGFDPVAAPTGSIRQIKSHTFSSKAGDNQKQSSISRKHSMM